VTSSEITVRPPPPSFNASFRALRRQARRLGIFFRRTSVRRIGHRGSALSGRWVLHIIALQNGSIGRHLFPTSRRNQKGSGPPSTVSLAVGGMVERLRL